MNFEDFQKSWQGQEAGARITINTDVLLNEVRRNQRQFRRTIFWRDFREVGVAFLLIPIFIYMGWQQQNWFDYVVAFACFVVGGYFLFDRWRQKKKQTSPDRHDSLLNCATSSLAELNHQIWLLQNILWWYLLPLGIPLVFSMFATAWTALAPEMARMRFLTKMFVLVVSGASGLFAIGVTVAVYAFIYWLNQWAVKKHLEPRRRELEQLLDGLEPENQPLPMKNKRPYGPLLIVLAASAIALAAQPLMKTTPGTGVEEIRKSHHLPALAVVVTKDGQICDRAVAGIRKRGEADLVTTNDVFHIGSCTKSMTATLAAMFIEAGKLRWDTTIAEVFPELKGTMDKRYEKVTVEQLLHHRGGVPHSPPGDAWKRAWQEIGTPMEQRREYLAAVLSAPPQADPGTEMIYSNDGYVIVGAILEKISGQDFESLMTEKLFKPLHMDTAGFGPPGTKGKVDQPWGHVRKLFMTVPVQIDNPPVHSACGRVHCSLDDLARYAMFHLQPTNGLLKPETVAKLHALPAGIASANEQQNYAGGWVVTGRKWGGTVLYHNGSNTTFYIVMWLSPENDFCVIAASNIFNDDAETACDEACVAMINKWLPQ